MPFPPFSMLHVFVYNIKEFGGGQLTFADLYSLWFMGLLLTLGMTAPACAASVCPLTQRPSSLLSEARSRSDYNLSPHPTLLLYFLWHLLTAAFPPHFTGDSHIMLKRGTSPQWPHFNQQSLIWLSSAAEQTGTSKWQDVSFVNKIVGDADHKHWGQWCKPKTSIFPWWAF